MWCCSLVGASRRIICTIFLCFLFIFGSSAWCPLQLPRLVRNGTTRAFLDSMGARSFETTNVARSFTKLNAKKRNSSANTKNKDENGTVVALLHSHHLLDHKPDNLILKGGKHKLSGAACLGRPGVALCIGLPKSIQKFKGVLESAMPQKRFKTKVLENVSSESCSTIDGFEEVSLGEFRSLLISIGEEKEFFALTGIAPEVASGGQGALTTTSRTSTNNRNGGSKVNKKKRKRK